MAQALDTDAPAFKAAVADAVAKQTADLAAQMAELKAMLQNPAASQASPQITLNEGLKAAFEHMGMTLADISAQGVGVQKPIPPEVIRAREEARGLMIERIIRAKRDKEIARYRVNAVIQADFGRAGQALVQPFWEDRDKVKQPTEIDWPGIPNSALVPLNEVAKEIMALYRDSVGNMGRVSAAEELKAIGPAFVHGAGGLIKKRDAPGQFDLEPEEGGVKVHNRGGRGATRRVNVLGTIAEPAEISG